MNAADSTRMTVYASLFAALTAAGAFIAVPVGPVPIVLQNFFVFLSGLLLGGRWGAISVSVYLVAGALGLPVFAGGTGGVGRFVGPTGGYLVGYLPAVCVIGWISGRARHPSVFDVLGLVCGTMVLYGFGIVWLKLLSGMTWPKTLTVGMVPFLPGDALKIAAAVPLAKALRPLIRKTR